MILQFPPDFISRGYFSSFGFTRFVYSGKTPEGDKLKCFLFLFQHLIQNPENGSNESESKRVSSLHKENLGDSFQLFSSNLI
jgi:hypothetical protein